MNSTPLLRVTWQFIFGFIMTIVGLYVGRGIDGFPINLTRCTSNEFFVCFDGASTGVVVVAIFFMAFGVWFFGRPTTRYLLTFFSGLIGFIFFYSILRLVSSETAFFLGIFSLVVPVLCGVIFDLIYRKRHQTPMLQKNI